MTFLKFVLPIVAAGAVANAGGMGQQVEVDLKDKVVQGEQTIELKDEVKQQQPEVDVDQSQLQAVEVVAKAEGPATVSLGIDQSQTADQSIGGQTALWNNNDSTTYDTVMINNTLGTSHGNWRLHVRGNVKIKKIILHLSSEFGALRHRPWHDDDDWRRPRPRPPFPRPFPRETRVVCESHNYRPASCYVGGRIQFAYVIRQHSFAGCVEGRDWFVDRFRGMIHVRNGCRATFAVRLARGGRW